MSRQISPKTLINESIDGEPIQNYRAREPQDLTEESHNLIDNQRYSPDNL